MARIVLIDDEDALREALSEVLVAAGHRAILAASGHEGLAAIRRERPDLVICDVNMPGMDGYGVLEAVRLDASLASTPFLFLSGLSQPAQARAGMNLGADDYLVKPVATADLLSSVDSRLARHAATRGEAQRRIDEIRRNVAVLLPHELRTPLTAIIGCAQMIQHAHGQLPAEVLEELAAGIVSGAERLHRMTENYLLYAGLELQRLARPEPAADTPRGGGCRAPDVREAAVAQAAAAGREEDLQLDLGDVRLAAPAPYVRKIVCELLDNAFKFSPAGSPVRLSLTPSGSEARLEVADRGRGMSAAQIREISAFRQFDRAVFEQQGSGLGLTLVRAIAEASGGRFALESEPALGTRATVEWRAAHAPDSDA